MTPRLPGSGIRRFAPITLCLCSAVLLSLCLPGLAEAAGEHGGGGGNRLWDLLWRLINFAILAFLLYKLLARPLKGFLRERQLSIKTALEEAARTKERAEARVREMEAKLEKASDEIARMKALLADQGRIEKEKMIRLAKMEAENIRKQTRLSAEQEVKKAHILLRKEAVEIASEMAEKLLRKQIEARDHDRLLRDYLEKVVNQD